MGGAWLGLGGIALAMGLAVLAGAVVGGSARITGRLGPQQTFPFGLFMALGIWLVWLMGPFLVVGAMAGGSDAMAGSLME